MRRRTPRSTRSDTLFPYATRFRSLLAEILVASLIVLGGGFAIIGSWALARLPSLMTRLHGPTKATTLGVGSCLVASMIYFTSQGGTWSAHDLLITLFIFITAPATAKMIPQTPPPRPHQPPQTTPGTKTP